MFVGLLAVFFLSFLLLICQLLRTYGVCLGLVCLFGTAYNLRDLSPSCRIGGSSSSCPICFLFQGTLPVGSLTLLTYVFIFSETNLYLTMWSLLKSCCTAWQNGAVSSCQRISFKKYICTASKMFCNLMLKICLGKQ